ncbi:MAG: hypothetical protein P8101_21525 [Candidatus Thiodiazotropha sp.]
MMQTRDPRLNLFLAITLALLMILTRGHHDFTLEHLPDASWAIFFLAGISLRSTGYFGLFFLLAVSLDYIAITWGGVSSFCVTGAYALLLPAYAALWYAGRSAKPQTAAPLWQNLPRMGLLALGGTLTCELVSSGGFYFFSGRFVDPSLTEFAPRLVKYLPGNLQSVALYLGMAGVVYAVISLFRRGSDQGLSKQA